MYGLGGTGGDMAKKMYDSTENLTRDILMGFKPNAPAKAQDETPEINWDGRF